MNRDGTIESPWRVDDTRDDVVAAYKDVMERSFVDDEQDTPAPKNEPAPAADPVDAPADSGAERARDPVTKRFVKGTPPSKTAPLHPDPNGTQPTTKTTDKKPEAVKEPEAAPNAEAAPEAVKAAPPPSFSIKTKAEWERLPEHVRADIAKRESEMQTGLAALRDYKDLKPYADMAKSHNTTIKDYIDRTIRVENLLNKDIGAGLAHIAQNYGLDQKQAATLFANLAQKFGAPVSGQPSGQPQQEADPLAELMKPMLEPIMSQLSELRTYQTTRTEADRNAHLQSVGEVVEAFASDPANKFYPDLEGQIVQLLENGMVQRTGDLTADLKTAYDMAARMNPAVHEALIEQRLTEQDEAKRKAEQDKVAKAKAASRSISGSRIPGTVVQQAEDEDEGDDIEAAARNAYRLLAQR